MGKKVLIADSDARGHAMAWLMCRDPSVDLIYMAPGNPGTHRVAESTGLAPEDIEGLAEFAEEKKIDLTVFSSDNPLAQGAVDLFSKRGLCAFGPSRFAAQVESSKALAKEWMRESGIPTAGFRIFRDYSTARSFVHRRQAPMVIKASGLALGKGAYVCLTHGAADEALAKIILKQVHGSAGDEVVVEDYLDGPELSAHVFTDGRLMLCCPTSQDHKTITEDPESDMTGGMGAVAPVPWFTLAMEHEIRRTIVEPILGLLRQRKHPFKGCLFPGLKKTAKGLYVLEFNARPGDPEWPTLALLFDKERSPYRLLAGCVDGTLAHCADPWRRDLFSASVVLASAGYPRAYMRGVPIFGVEDAERVDYDNVAVFHAGTAMQDGRLVTDGGRVLTVVGRAPSLQGAVDLAYEAADRIRFDGKQCRRDIGKKALEEA